MDSKLRIIVTGFIAQYPLGGVTWDYIQYVLGLHKLGHEVFYLEDTHHWPYSPITGGVADDCAFNVSYLSNAMSHFGLAERWSYRFPWQSQWFGLTNKQRDEVLRSADLLINVSGSLGNPEKYRHIPRLIYIDSDPVFTQVKLARGQQDFRHSVDMHDVFFSFGESLSIAIPSTGHTWNPTRQPIVLAEWRPSSAHREVFTTVMNWSSFKEIQYQGRTYGQKDIEFERFIELPRKLPDIYLEIAVNAGKSRRTPRHRLRQQGWHVVDPEEVCADLSQYRSYIESSKAEWSVAKQGYVVGQPGWFSCRSACYLAAGKPVIVQDTGFDEVLPTGEGILSFQTMAQAISAIREIEANYRRHALAARKIAEDYFDSDRVLSRLIEVAFADVNR